MSEKFKASFMWLFHILCISLLIYTSTLLVLRYLKNEDYSKLSYKKFNESPEDLYPEFTVCFNKGVNKLYKNNYLKAHFSGNFVKYHNFLNGKLNRVKNNQYLANITNVDFDNATLGMNDLIPYYKATFSGNYTMTNSRKFFNKTYQIPGQICFSRHASMFRQDKILFKEQIHVNLSLSSVRIYVHYPKQVLRNVFGHGVALKSILTLEKANPVPSKEIQITLSQLDVIKKRPDGKIPCNLDGFDDWRFWTEVSKRINCLPSYWKTFNAVRAKLKPCVNVSQFEVIENFRTWGRDKKEEIISSIDPPCNDLRVTANVNGKGDTAKNNTLTKLALYYVTKEYLEIKNQRDFDGEMLWSSIGGFVGMFAGYGLLQVLIEGFDWVVGYMTR